ncbi:T-cell surface antigen CD2-like [Girardinichthys multiradiatus]|uniref:T-cell surface antigen CD2-like n=1 Tax=Girardinichthys multiradiatus TaxID=208333 RepID=UPI001FAE42F8|nr:T-cell surface antigen CD2-like [Girardinichthys multiradiatus]
MMESSSFQPNMRRTTMKMASMPAASVFLLCCFAVTSVASQVCDQYAAMGRNFKVPLGYKLKPTDTLKWKFEDVTIFHQKQANVLMAKSNVNADGSLELTNLKKDQAGVYIPEVYDQSGKSRTMKSTNLCVLDPVKKPKVDATCKNPNDVEFKCIPDKVSDKQPGNVEYEWLQNEKVVKEKKYVFNMKAADTKADKFVCKVSNKASSETSESVTHNCAKIGLFGISIWVFVGGGAGIVILLIIIVIVCFVQSKRKRKLRLKDEEEFRLDWTTTQQQNHHHHLPPLPDHPPPHHHHRHQQQQQQQQAPGNTGPRQSRSKQNRQPRPRAPEPNGQPEPSPRRAVQEQKPANDADDEKPPPLPQPRKKVPKGQID